MSLQPIVTIEEAAAYDPERPETKTKSRVVNLIIENIGKIRPFQLNVLAGRLGIDPIAITGALMFDTGLRYQDFLDEWRKLKLRDVFKSNPRLGGDKLAESLGFTNRSSMSVFQKKFRLHNEIQKARMEACKNYQT